MNKKKLVVTLSIFFILIVGAILFLIITDNKKSENKVKTDVTETKKVEEKVKSDDETNEDVSAEEIEEQTSEVNQEESVETQEVSNTTTNTSSSQTTSVSQQTTPTTSNSTQAVSTPVVVKQPTEWEKLGISEYDYYNSPRPNEGEIAFREPESKCERVSNEITNMYHFTTSYGDVHSYSEDYIGCWLIVYMRDGSWIFYKEFKQREARGEFNN